MSRIALPLALLLMMSLAACNTPSDSAPSDSAPSDSTPTDSASTATPTQTPAAGNASPTSPSATAPVADVAKRCDAGKAQSAVGQTASQDVVDKAVSDSGSSTARVIKPGQAVTMDFREDRLNIEVDAGNVVTAVRCG